MDKIAKSWSSNSMQIMKLLLLPDNVCLNLTIQHGIIMEPEAQTFPCPRFVHLCMLSPTRPIRVVKRRAVCPRPQVRGRRHAHATAKSVYAGCTDTGERRKYAVDEGTVNGCQMAASCDALVFCLDPVGHIVCVVVAVSRTKPPNGACWAVADRGPA